MSQLPTKSFPKVRQVNVSAEEAGQRIDNFLARYLKGVPKSHIYRILRRGEVRVNSGRIRAQYKICAGDTVRIPPVRIAPAKSGQKAPDFSLEKHILFENQRCLVINKPSGIAVHGGSGVSHGVIEALRAERPQAPYIELGHRLDRETSGCLVLAKRRSFLRAFHEQLRHGRVEKHYLALVAGAWKGGKQTVDVPLRKNQLRGGERMVTVDADGKQAVSVISPVSCYKNATLVEVVLKTGRTHQIRVHGTHIGHPLAGDKKYGDPVFNRQMRALGLRRMLLHAHLLEFTDPSNDEVITVSSPLGDDVKAVLAQLESS
ncbi:MAG: RluA family pseudouridine synthase [Gammaproteobacteria bacterium]|nr:RluA family pseudouridine synthase [Gammaproteobacteria bacterium]